MRWGNAVDTAVHRAAVRAVRRTKVHVEGHFPISGDMESVFDQFVYSLVFRRRNGNDGNPQFRFQRVDVYRPSAAAYFVHHIEGDDHGDIQRDELKGQIEIPFDIRRVENIDDGVGLFLQEKLPRHDLLSRVRGKGNRCRAGL